MKSGHEIVAECYRAFDRWRAEHDPYGEMDILDATLEYYIYAGKHGIKKYLNASDIMAKDRS